MKKLKSKIKKLNQDKNFVSFISYEDDLKFQKNTELNLAREEGIEKGEKASKIEIAKKMIEAKEPLEKIVQFTNLTLEEINKLK